MTTSIQRLKQLFKPPQSLWGTQMLLCAMTAEADVLNAALEAFTGEVGASHAARGRLVGTLMLDAAQPLFAPEDIHGLMQIAAPSAGHWSSRTCLLHAKVALLGFGPAPFGATTHMRLIVSTGNWTREAFGPGEIDMFWRTDCALAEKGLARNDCAAALAFFNRLLTDIFGLSNSMRPPAIKDWLTRWEAAIPHPDPRTPTRFVHSLHKPLIDQIHRRFARTKYRTLVCGSGFYEQSNGAGAQPEVFERIDKVLCRGTKRRYVVVNKDRAGALADWFAASGTRKWSPRMPVDPLSTRGGRGALHAKFIAGLSGGDERGYRIACLYLGSGNLSRRGLMSHANPGGRGKPGRAGNVEAGVVFVPEQSPDDVLQALACGAAYPPRALRQFQSGDEEPNGAAISDGPPIRWLEVVEDRLLPRWSEGETAAQCHCEDKWVQLVADRPAGQWPSRFPQAIRVRREEGHPEFLVPVFGADGSYCRSAPVPMSAESALDAILGFPRYTPPENDGDDDGETDGGVDMPEGLPPESQRRAPSRQKTVRYPVRWVATLLEGIARQHESLSPDQYDVWFSHLRMVLCEQVFNGDRDAIREWGVNPFPVLLKNGFRPTDLDEFAAARYAQLVEAISFSWFGSKVSPAECE